MNLATKRRIRRRLHELTLIRLPATPLEVEAGRPIWNGSGIVRRLVADRRKP